MKKIILSALILFSIFSFSEKSYGQTNADLISKFKNKETARTKRISDYITANPIPVRGYDKKGNYMILKDIVSGKPVYTVTRSKNVEITLYYSMENKEVSQPITTEELLIISDALKIVSQEPIQEIILMNDKMRTVFYTSNCNGKEYNLSLKHYPRSNYILLINANNSIKTSKLKLK